MLRALIVIAVVLSSGSVQGEPIASLRFVGGVTLPHNLIVDGTRVGGLSGLDYDVARDSFLVISDDRSDFAPARFYEMKAIFADGRLTAVDVLSTASFLQSDGTPYPNGKQGGDVPDPEAIRLDPLDAEKHWWTSEGDRARGLKPFLRVTGRNGKFLGDTAVPDMFTMLPAQERGPRQNLAFEGLSFAVDGRSLWLAMEGALYEDGPAATPDAASVARFTHLSRDGKLLGQFAYLIDPIPGRPGPGKFADNGVTEILALDEHRLLVVERAAIQGEDGVFRNDIRLYEADLSDASDISAIPALADADYRPLGKRLVANLGVLMQDARIDNIEGMSWGPTLANGGRTLILVSDDNFNKAQVTQVLAFEVLP